jgi:hypothetical protein
MADELAHSHADEGAPAKPAQAFPTTQRRIDELSATEDIPPDRQTVEEPYDLEGDAPEYEDGPLFPEVEGLWPEGSDPHAPQTEDPNPPDPGSPPVG